MYLFNGWNVLPATAPLRLSEVLEADSCRTVTDPPPIACCGAQVLDQVRIQRLRAGEVSRNDRQQPPGTLTRLRVLRFVAGRLLHQLTVDLVAEFRMLVTVLRKY